jgi:hypothetical protein
MTILEAILGMLGAVGSFMTVGVVLLGIPWALYTLARTSRTTDELLRVQRDILRELQRARAGAAPDQPADDETAPPPKQPWW